MQGREREIDTLSVRSLQPHSTNLLRKRRERENSWRQKRREQLGQQKGIGPALETRQSHTIEYGVNQIVPERYWEGNKSPVVLRGSAAGRRITANITSAACRGWGLHNEDFLAIRECVLSCMPSLHIKSIGMMSLFHDVVRFLPCCRKKGVECAGTYGGVLEIAFGLLRFSRYLLPL